MNLRYEISIVEPVVIYSFNGKIIADPDYELLETEVFNFLNQNHKNIVFDLNELTHINSSGIAFFMRTLTKSRIMGGDLILTSIGGNVEKIFNIAKLNEIYTIYASADEAIAHFNK